MQPLQNSLKLFCLFFFSLLAACSGGEQPEPPQVASQDTIAADTVKTLEEKNPEYEIEHFHTEYFYEVDASAPVIYSKVESWVREDLNLIVYRHTDIRESRSAMDSLPENIQEYLRQNSIVIPGFSIRQSYFRNNKVYLKGQLNENNLQDWVVMCYKDGYCWITVFWDGETTDTSIVNYKPIIQGDGGRDIFRTLLLVSNDRDTSRSYDDLGFFTSLYSSYEYHLWPQSSPRPDIFNNEGFAEKYTLYGGYYYYYFDNGNLLTWGDAMPGWEKWHERNMVTMQDSLLLDPTLCEDIPSELAIRWREDYYKIAKLGDDPWCIKGEFVRKGQTDCLVWLYSSLKQYPDPTFDLKLITADTTYSIVSMFGGLSVQSFKHTRYCKIDPEEVTYMYQDNLGLESWPLFSETDSLSPEPQLSPPFDHDGFFLGELDPYTFEPSLKPYEEEYVIYLKNGIKWFISPYHGWKHLFSDLFQ